MLRRKRRDSIIMRAMSHAVALSLLLLSAAACHQEDVMVHTAEGQESAVGRYASFSVVLPDPKDLENEGMTGEALQQIAKLSVEQMQQRGYQPAAPEQADLLIVFGPRVDVYGTTHTNSSTGHPDDKYDQTMHAQGTLTVVFVDAKTKEQILRRVAQTRLLQGGPAEEKMRTGVAQIFEGVPRASAPAAATAAPTAPAAAAPPGDPAAPAAAAPTAPLAAPAPPKTAETKP
jgi:hypothetical protein